MKKLYKFIIATIIIIFVVILSISYNNYRNNKILSTEENQIEILDEIYRGFISGEVLNDLNMTLDESAYKNLITKEKFSASGIDKLKAVEVNYQESKKNLILYSKYSNKNKILILELNGEGLHIIHKYKLSVRNGKITYESNGNGIMSIS